MIRGMADTAELMELMQRMGRRVRRVVGERMAECGMSLPLAAALRELDDPLPMSALAERLSCDASYVTGLADRLEERNLVERVPDPDDRRVKQLVLTDRGRAVRGDVEARLREGHAWVDRLEDGEVETLVRILRKALAE